MINAVAIQRLLEAAILLKLERGTRAASGQADQPKPSINGNTALQPQTPGQAQAAQSRRPAQIGTWSLPNTLAAETQTVAMLAVPVTARETPVAPLAYRESLAEAAGPAQRPYEQAGFAPVLVPAPIQYAHAELARALTAKSARAASGATLNNLSQATGIKLKPSSAAERDNQRRNIILGALLGGTALLAAALGLAVLT